VPSQQHRDELYCNPHHHHHPHHQQAKTAPHLDLLYRGVQLSGLALPRRHLGPQLLDLPRPRLVLLQRARVVADDGGGLGLQGQAAGAQRVAG
jgi:hypothetical protein